jgi:hypothetical protein
MPAGGKRCPPATLATFNTYLERKSIMTKQENITFLVWLEIERFNAETGDGVNMDAPGSSLATFATYEEAWDYAERVTRLTEGINL